MHKLKFPFHTENSERPITSHYTYMQHAAKTDGRKKDARVHLN